MRVVRETPYPHPRQLLGVRVQGLGLKHFRCFAGKMVQ